MSEKFRLTGPAREHLIEIWDHILEQSASVEVADKVITNIYEAFAILGEHPQAGHLREDLTGLPVRFWSVYRYLIVYSPDSSPIEIVAVIHSAQDVAALPADDRPTTSD